MGFQAHLSPIQGHTSVSRTKEEKNVQWVLYYFCKKPYHDALGRKESTDYMRLLKEINAE